MLLNIYQQEDFSAMQAGFLVYIYVSIDNFYGQNLHSFKTSMITLTLLKH